MNPSRLLPLCLLLFAALAQAGQGLSPLPKRPAPELGLRDLNGHLHRLRDYRGQVLIVNFWATWCPPCRAEMPSMEAAWQQLKGKNIRLLAVNVGETEDQVWAFTAEYDLSFPLLLDEDGKAVRRWPVRGLPTTFVVDPQGNLTYQALGERDWADPKLLGKIRALAADR